MAWRVEKTEEGADIVIDGFEKGIATSPYQGIADMRNVNIAGAEAEASVNLSMASLILPPLQTAIAFNATAATDIVTLVSGTTAGYYNGMAIRYTGATSGGLTASNYYWIGDITATTFKLYSNLQLANLVDITSNLTNQTFDVAQIGQMTFSTSNFPGKQVFMIDSNGRAWLIRQLASTSGTNVIAQNAVQCCGNSTVGNGEGLCFFVTDLFVFRASAIDYITSGNLVSGDVNANWVYGWKVLSNSTNYLHHAIAATDSAMYFCAGSAVGSVLINAGQVFDPGTAATFTFNENALKLPATDAATYLAQLGVFLLVGGLQNYVYPWNRTATSFNYPLILAEARTYRIVSTNSNAYIFAGQRGRIYVTNGSNIQQYKKFPDSLSGTVYPYYMPQDAVYWRDQIFFSYVAYDSSGNALSNTGGIWSIDAESGALSGSAILSYGTYAGACTVITNQINDLAASASSGFPTGLGLYAAWSNSGTFGIDIGSNTPYTSYQTRIDSDLIPIGSFLKKRTFQNIEWKLGKPLVANESVRLSWRGNLTDAFTVIGTTTTAGLVSDAPYSVNFEGQQWLQIRYEGSSTASSPSFVPLREMRFR